MIYPRTIHGYWKLKQNTMKTEEIPAIANALVLYHEKGYDEALRVYPEYKYLIGLCKRISEKNAKEVAIAFAKYVSYQTLAYWSSDDEWEMRGQAIKTLTSNDLFEKFIQSIKPWVQHPKKQKS